MIFRSGLRSRISCSSVGPSISGITTSDTTRSTGAVAALEHLHRLDAVAGLEHRITARAKPARIQRAQALLVLDQQDGALPGQIGLRLGLGSASWRRTAAACRRFGGDFRLRMCRGRKMRNVVPLPSSEST